MAIETFYQRIMRLNREFIPESRGFINDCEVALIKKVLQLNGMDTLSLHNMRDMVVLVLGRLSEKEGISVDDEMRIMDKISAIVAVIDSILCHYGYEV